MTLLINKFSLGHLLLINIGFIFAFMVINSFLCGDGLEGGECVKHKDNIAFLTQLGINGIFLMLLLIKGDRKRWWVPTLNIILTTIVYVVAAFIRSVSKAGLF